jgi:hypothetical protein
MYIVRMYSVLSLSQGSDPSSNNQFMPFVLIVDLLSLGKMLYKDRYIHFLCAVLCCAVLCCAVLFGVTAFVNASCQLTR